MNSQRFGGIERLYGQVGAAKLAQVCAAVVGIGGVGSWAAEALARSGVGKIILMDLDDICLTNTNRQIHALEGNYGQLKTSAMAQRLKLINPELEIVELVSFYSGKKPDALFDCRPDVIIDAIDSMRAKTHLIAESYKRKIPLVTCGGAGGRIDASCISVADLARTCGDNMLSQLRKKLRQEYGFELKDKGPELGIPCVYSPEKPRYPTCDGGISQKKQEGQLGGIGCASGLGSATHVTGCFGFMAAGAALDLLLTH